jgi:hypothetical protein
MLLTFIGLMIFSVGFSVSNTKYHILYNALKIPDMVCPQRTLRYPYNKVQGPPIIVGWTMMVSTGMGNGTHNLLIGGHESLPPRRSIFFTFSLNVGNIREHSKECMDTIIYWAS